MKFAQKKLPSGSFFIKHQKREMADTYVSTISPIEWFGFPINSK